MTVTERVLVAVSIAGTLAGVMIAIGGITWHGMSTDTPATLAAGAAIGASFFLLGARSVPFAAAVISGAVALVLAAAAGWTVPFLLFWLCCNTALALGSSRGWFSRVNALALLADLPLVAGLVLFALRDDVWRLPDQPGTAIVAAVCFSALARIVVVAFDRDRGPAAPLVAGSGFVLLATLGPEASPTVAAILIGAAVAVAFRPVSSDPATFVSLLAVGATLLYAPALPMAAIATVLALAASGSASQTARPGIVLLAGPWPGTALFAAMTTAAVHSAERVAETGLLSGGPYLVASFLLPLALAGSVQLAGPLIRGRVELPWGRAEVCALVGIVAGLSATGFSAPDPSGYLYLSALAAGVLFVIGVPESMLPPLEPEPGSAIGSGTRGIGRFGPMALRRAGLVALALAWVGVAWATYGGLRDGFL